MNAFDAASVFSGVEDDDASRRTTSVVTEIISKKTAGYRISRPPREKPASFLLRAWEALLVHRWKTRFCLRTVRHPEDASSAPLRFCSMVWKSMVQYSNAFLRLARRFISQPCGALMIKTWARSPS